MSDTTKLVSRDGATPRVAVIGAGSWGTAMARHFALRGAKTRLLGRRAEQAEAIRSTGKNPAYLRDTELPASLEAGVYTAGSLEDVDLVVMAVPSKGYAAVAASLVDRLPHGVNVLSLTKGVEPGSPRRFSEVLADLWGRLEPRIAILAGPNHAEEVSLDQPTATVVASSDPGYAESLQLLLSNESFRAYVNHDLIGVELASAVKNVIALATGMADGLGYGDNVRAALITRGLAEMARLGMALGAEPLTFAGLAGLGDLVATCTSQHSRNRLAGELIAHGHPPDEVEEEMGMVAEGLTVAPAILALAHAHDVEMPITCNVVAVVYEQKPVRDCVADLMLREPRTERH